MTGCILLPIQLRFITLEVNLQLWTLSHTLRIFVVFFVNLLFNLRIKTRLIINFGVKITVSSQSFANFVRISHRRGSTNVIAACRRSIVEQRLWNSVGMLQRLAVQYARGVAGIDGHFNDIYFPSSRQTLLFIILRYFSTIAIFRILKLSLFQMAVGELDIVRSILDRSHWTVWACIILELVRRVRCFQLFDLVKGFNLGPASWTLRFA